MSYIMGPGGRRFILRRVLGCLDCMMDLRELAIDRCGTTGFAIGLLVASLPSMGGMLRYLARERRAGNV